MKTEKLKTVIIVVLLVAQALNFMAFEGAYMQHRRQVVRIAELQKQAAEIHKAAFYSGVEYAIHAFLAAADAIRIEPDKVMRFYDTWHKAADAFAREDKVIP